MNINNSENRNRMKTTMFKYLMTGAVALIVAGLNLTAQALPPIQGDISFVGGATLNGPLATATAFTSFFGPTGTGNPVVLSTNGDYDAVPAGTTTAAFTTFAFNGSQTLPATQWNFTVGTTDYSFQMTSISIFVQNSSFLDIQGNGIAHIDGFNNTSGTWSITDTGGSSAVFSLGANVSVVPEPATIGCFLLGLGALACSRRFRQNAR
jgi:hypothetical protein